MFGRKNTNKLIEDIDRYFSLMDQTVLVFKDGVRNFLYSNKDSFNENLKSLSSLETRIDVESGRAKIKYDSDKNIKVIYQKNSGKDSTITLNRIETE